MIPVGKTKILQAYMNSATYDTASAILGYSNTNIDTTDGRVQANSNGVITVNYNGLVRIKAQIWINGPVGVRPWIMLHDYDSKETLTEVIDDNSSGYVTVTIEKIVKNTGIQNYDITVNGSVAGFTINGNSGRTVGSILIVELM